MIILFDDDSVWNENAMRYYKNLYKDIVPVNCDGNGFSIINTISIYELYTNDNLQYLKKCEKNKENIKKRWEKMEGKRNQKES